MCWYTHDAKVHYSKDFVYVFGEEDTIDPAHQGGKYVEEKPEVKAQGR
jgi:hypothetical protein